MERSRRIDRKRVLTLVGIALTLGAKTAISKADEPSKREQPKFVSHIFGTETKRTHISTVSRQLGAWITG